MNGMGRFWVGAAWLQLYWGAFALMLVVLAHLLWRRGTDDARCGRGSRAAAAAARRRARAAGVRCGRVRWRSGAWIFYNTNV